MQFPNFKVSDGNGSLSFLSYDVALSAFLDIVDIYNDGTTFIDKDFIKDCLKDDLSYALLFGDYPNGFYTIVAIEIINDEFPLQNF